MKKNKVLITGINGQDGAYLANYLLKKKYRVFGILRRSSNFKLNRLEFLNIRDKISFFHCELEEHKNLEMIIKKIKPNYIFNLAAQSFVKYSFENPDYTLRVNTIAVLNILEIIRRNNLNIKFYQASTSEMYGNTGLDMQDENTKFSPDSPYAISKLAAHNLVKNYREAYNIFCCSGILFNHESFLRGIEFVTKKIVYGLVEIRFGSKKPVKLGNIYSKRDWGHAEDYVEAMFKIINSKKPSDFVVCTGKTYSIKKFFIIAAKKIGFEPIFSGTKLNEKCYDKKTGKLLLSIDKKYYREKDLIYLRGSSKKIKRQLNWKPKHNLESLIRNMVKLELENFNKGKKFSF